MLIGWISRSSAANAPRVRIGQETGRTTLLDAEVAAAEVATEVTGVTGVTAAHLVAGHLTRFATVRRLVPRVGRRVILEERIGDGRPDEGARQGCQDIEPRPGPPAPPKVRSIVPG